MQNNNVNLGKIVSTVGLKGGVKVLLYSSDPIWTDRKVYLQDDKIVACIKYPYGGKRNICLCKIEGIDSIVEAKNFVGQEIFLPRSEMPDLEHDEFYYHDVIGKPVYQNGKEIDLVFCIHDFGSGTVFQLNSGKYIHIQEVKNIDETGIRLG